LFIFCGATRAPEVPDRPLVVAARPDEVLGRLDQDLLSPIERRRCAEPRHADDRDARAAAHLLVRWAAAQVTCRPVESLVLVQRCPDCGAADHGRPAIAGTSLHVSLGHARGVVVASAHTEPVGVDVERATSGADAPADRSVALTSAESRRVGDAADPAREFLHHWVLKESLVKIGVATLDTLAGIEVRAGAVRHAADGRTVSRRGALHLVDWFDEELDAVLGAAAHRPPLVRPFSARGRP
jgi:4'-phosphopantetheinyl transferase